MTEEINYINPPIQLVFNFYFLFQTLFTSSVQLHPLTNNSFWTFQPNFLFKFFLFFSKTCFPKLSLKSTFTTDHLNQLLLFQQDHSYKLTRATPSQLSKWEQRYHAAPWKRNISYKEKHCTGSESSVVGRMMSQGLSNADYEEGAPAVKVVGAPNPSRVSSKLTVQLNSAPGASLELQW